MQKQTLKINAERIIIAQALDGIEATLYNINPLDLLDQLLDGAYQQDIIKRVLEVVKDHEEINEINRMIGL